MNYFAALLNPAPPSLFGTSRIHKCLDDVSYDDGKLRRCCQCKQWKVEAEEFYTRMRPAGLRYHAACKECFRENARNRKAKK